MWAALLASMSQRIKEKRYRKDIIRKAEDESLANGPSWKYRRRLIHGAYILGFAMVLFGAGTIFLTDTQIGVEMIIGGVALVSIIVTAYTTSATYEDVRVWNHNPRIRFGSDQEPMHDYETNNPDGT